MGKKVEQLTDWKMRSSSTPISISHPEVAVSFHRKRNCGLGPEDFSHGSTIEVWWFCDKSPDHVYQTAVKARIRGASSVSSGCPFCAGKRPSPTNWLHSFKKVAGEFHPTRNGKLTPKKIVSASDKRVFWKCPDCSHVYLQTPCARTRFGAGCPKCNHGERLNLNKFPLALHMFDFQKNKGVDHTSLDSTAKVWWKCPVAKDHRFKAGFYKANGRKPDCPFCRGRKSSSTNNLTMNKRLTKEFHPKKNGALKPQDLTVGSHTKIWWKCPKGPDHEWQQHVFMRKRGLNCPFCSGFRLSKTNVLAAHPKLAKELHPKLNGNLTASEILATAQRKLYWLCSKCSCTWEMSPYRRVTEGVGCPECHRTKSPRGRLSTRQKEKALKLLRQSIPVASIASIIGVHIMTIYRLRDKHLTS